jgi:hypothetical protein
MQTYTIDTNAGPLSWRPAAWLREAGYPFSRPVLYREIRAGRLDARKAGRSTLILTSPRDYLTSLPKGISAPVGRGRKRQAAE